MGTRWGGLVPEEDEGKEDGDDSEERLHVLHLLLREKLRPVSGVSRIFGTIQERGAEVHLAAIMGQDGVVDDGETLGDNASRGIEADVPKETGEWMEGDGEGGVWERREEFGREYQREPMAKMMALRSMTPAGTARPTVKDTSCCTYAIAMGRRVRRGEEDGLSSLFRRGGMVKAG